MHNHRIKNHTNTKIHTDAGTRTQTNSSRLKSIPLSIPHQKMWKIIIYASLCVWGISQWAIVPVVQLNTTDITDNKPIVWSMHLMLIRLLLLWLLQSVYEHIISPLFGRQSGATKWTMTTRSLTNTRQQYLNLRKWKPPFVHLLCKFASDFFCCSPTTMHQIQPHLGL